MAAKSINDYLFDDLFSKIFIFLEPDELLKVIRTSKRYRNICESHDELWLHHVQKLWSRVKFNVPWTLNLQERVDSLSMKDLRVYLRPVDTRGCIEKSDYHRLLIAHLLIGHRFDKVMGNTFFRFILGNNITTYPDWTLSINNGKASYYYAKLELSRQRISLSELVAIEWEVTFNGASSSWISTFNKDFTMTSGYLGGTLNWEFVQGVWGDRRIKIRIENYPPLQSIRNTDGTWILSSIYAVYRQKYTIPPNKIQLLGIYTGMDEYE